MLKKEQIEFLGKVVPLASLISDYTFHKTCFTTLDESPAGIFPSVIVAEILIQSNWGEHPVCREEILYNTPKGVSKRYSNNLALVPAGEIWKGKANPYDGVTYRAYKDWMTFAADFSDHFVFSGGFNDLLLTETPEEQLKLYSLTKPDPECYYSSMITTITMAQFYLDGRTKEN